MKMLSKFSRVERHYKQHNSEHSTHILQCIKGLKTEAYAQPDSF